MDRSWHLHTSHSHVLWLEEVGHPCPWLDLQAPLARLHVQQLSPQPGNLLRIQVQEPPLQRLSALWRVGGCKRQLGSMKASS